MNEVHLLIADLWPGAEEKDLREVVRALQREGLRVRAAGSARARKTNVSEILEIADTFRAVALVACRNAEERALGEGADLRAKKLGEAQRRFEKALQERDRWEQELQEAARRLESHERAAAAFKKATRELAGTSPHDAGDESHGA